MNGLRLWAENFERVGVLARLDDGAPPEGYVEWTGDEPWSGRVALHGLPSAWTPGAFARALGPGRKLIRAQIAAHDRLCFAIGGLFGDWGAVAGLEARAMGRPFAVWTDRVESDVVRQACAGARGLRRLKLAVEWRLMGLLERAVVRRCALGLFHGKATFDAYAPHCVAPHVVHDVHLSDADLADAETVAAKRAAALGDESLRLVYAGRATEMKGGLDWIDTLAALRAAGIAVEAEWLGDGEQLGAMKARAAELGLGDAVAFRGYVDDREAVLTALRRAHLLLFCHKTLESPRILIETMHCATPFAGYADAYSEDLEGGAEAALLTPKHDVQALAQAVAELWSDRARLAQMTARARDRAGAFTDAAVFAHRGDLLKKGLPAA